MSNNSYYIQASAFQLERLIETTGQKAMLLHHLIAAGDEGITCQDVGMDAKAFRARISELIRTYDLLIFSFSDPSELSARGRKPHRYFLKTHIVEAAYHE